jgi:hypothetical protein
LFKWSVETTKDISQDNAVFIGKSMKFSLNSRKARIISSYMKKGIVPKHFNVSRGYKKTRQIISGTKMQIKTGTVPTHCISMYALRPKSA